MEYWQEMGQAKVILLTPSSLSQYYKKHFAFFFQCFDNIMKTDFLEYFEKYYILLEMDRYQRFKCCARNPLMHNVPK